MSIRSIAILLGISALILNGCGQASVRPDGEDGVSLHRYETEMRRIMGKGDAIVKKLNAEFDGYFLAYGLVVPPKEMAAARAALKKVGKTWRKGMGDLAAIYAEFAKLHPPSDLKEVHASVMRTTDLYMTELSKIVTFMEKGDAAGFAQAELDALAQYHKWSAETDVMIRNAGYDPATANSERRFVRLRK
jgi:hypothetical protein